MMKNENGKLEIHRPSQRRNKSCTFPIIIDSEEVDTISDGERISIIFSPGVHTIYTKKSWLKSSPVQVDISPINSTELIITSNGLLGYKYWLSLIIMGIVVPLGASMGVAGFPIMILGCYFASSYTSRPVIITTSNHL